MSSSDKDPAEEVKAPATEEIETPAEEVEEVEAVETRSWWRRNYLYVLSFVLGAAAIALIPIFGGKVKEFENFGYLGVFLMGVIGSAAPVWPMPGSWAAFIAAGLGWNIVWVGLAAGIGEAIGEVAYYGLGYSGQPLLKKVKWYPRVEGWMRRRGWLTIFLASAIPNFIIRLVDVSAAALRYPLWKFFLFCWAGKTVKSFAFAAAGAGLFAWLTNLF
jgi:uncharacterized membrane protein YdjX (TVP38/TMEM64 family)